MTKLLVVLTAVTALMALGAAAGIKPKIFATVEAVSVPATVTISTEALHRQVDVNTLPVTEIKDLY
ncbi:MAG: hypothetical protein JWL84_4849 [Rhodospirillales bacterium]|nr:hypothetical protein [Rhodospirillales bacterium]